MAHPEELAQNRLYETRSVFVYSRKEMVKKVNDLHYKYEKTLVNCCIFSCDKILQEDGSIDYCYAEIVYTVELLG